MIEPSVSLTTAMRAKLIATPAVTALVPADHIRTGSTRPDKHPCIIFGDARINLHGHDYRSARMAMIDLDIHVWTIDAGQDTAKAIAFAVSQALDTQLAVPECDLDEFKIVRIVYPRDPDPKYGHAVLSIQALMRWYL